jgi:hypothetical protein
MSDTAIVLLLAMLGPVVLVGILANLVLWFGNRSLPYNEEYEHEQRRDRQHLARQARLATKKAA